MANRKKQEDRHLSILKDLVQQPQNKKCFDCGQRGPTYVNMTIGAFVCTSCSGLLRGLNPPHRVKSISMASFSWQEIEFLEKHGNEVCRSTWLALWTSPLAPEPESREEQKVKDFLIRKYERKVWYSNQTKPKAQEDVVPEAKPLKELLGESAPTVQVKSEKPAPAKNSVQVLPPLSHEQPSPTQTHTSSGGQKKTSSMDLLGDLGADPFGSSQQNASSFPAFNAATAPHAAASFDAFGPSSPAARLQPQAPGQAQPVSSSFDFFSGGAGAPAGMGSAPLTSVNDPGRDRYAAFADLGAMGSGLTQSVFSASANLGAGPKNQPNPFMSASAGSGGAHVFQQHQQQQQQRPANPFQNAPSASTAFGQTSNFGAQAMPTSSWNMIGQSSGGMGSSQGAFVGMSSNPTSYGGVAGGMARSQGTQPSQPQGMSFGPAGVAAGTPGQYYGGAASAQPIQSGAFAPNIHLQSASLSAGYSQPQQHQGLQMFSQPQQMFPQQHQQLGGYGAMPAAQGFPTQQQQQAAQIASQAGLYNGMQQRPAQQFSQGQPSFGSWGQTAGGFPGAQQTSQAAMSKSTNPFL